MYGGESVEVGGQLNRQTTNFSEKCKGGEGGAWGMGGPWNERGVREGSGGKAGKGRNFSATYEKHGSCSRSSPPLDRVA